MISCLVMHVEGTFKQQLLGLKNSDKKSVLLTKEEYFNLVEELKEALKESSSKTGRQYYVLSRLNDLTYNDGGGLNRTCSSK